MTRWLVDASNVIGSRPDGWWRDRTGATQRLLDALREFARDEDEVVVVLDAGPAALRTYQGRGLEIYEERVDAALLPDAPPEPWPGAARPPA